MERRTLTVDETAAVLGIGRSAAYEAIRERKIPAHRIGRRIVVSKAELARFLGEPQEADQ